LAVSYWLLAIGFWLLAVGKEDKGLLGLRLSASEVPRGYDSGFGVFTNQLEAIAFHDLSIFRPFVLLSFCPFDI